MVFKIKEYLKKGQTEGTKISKADGVNEKIALSSIYSSMNGGANMIHQITGTTSGSQHCNKPTNILYFISESASDSKNSVKPFNPPRDPDTRFNRGDRRFYL